MQSLRSPGTLVTLAGAALTVIGSLAYVSENPNLSLPTIFYGIPILLGGLALKSSELPPQPASRQQASSVSCALPPPANHFASSLPMSIVGAMAKRCILRVRWRL